MARYKSYSYSQRVLIPVSLEDQLMPGTLEFAIHTLVETRMDTSFFDGKHKNDETGSPAYDPKILLKVVLLAYSRGIISSRKIERACRENVIFMALSCKQCPDHSTIAGFVSSMKGEILPLFRDVLLVCEEMNLLGGTAFALDGCKLPSNASSKWSGTFPDLQKKKEKIEIKINKLLQEQIQTDKRDGGGQDSFVSEPDRDKQIEKLKKQAARIESWLKENEPKIGTTGKEVKSNITDNESAKMVTSHGTIQGYNGQALVDSKNQVILHAEAFGSGQDHDHVPPILDGAKENVIALGHSEEYFKGAILTADTGYHSQTNLSRCEDEGLDAYIPDRDFRKRDPRFVTRERHQPVQKRKFSLEDFHHDQSTDQYECPGGKILRLQVKRWSDRGNIYRRYVAEETDCQNCPLRGKCIRRRNAKRKCLTVPIGSEPTNLTKRMVGKIESERGQKIYPQRMAIVEPVFGNIRTQKRLDRFTVRGRIKVTIQWLLYCMVHNIEKIATCGLAC
jgi:transposase/IS5 family transposase